MDERHLPTPTLRYGPTSIPPHPAPPSRRPSRVPPALWPLLVLIVAAAVGAAVAVTITAVGTAGSDDDGWGELGAFILGAVLGLAAFGVTYLAGLVIAAWRAFPRGRRLLPLALSLAIPGMLLASSVALGAVARSQGIDFPAATGLVTFVGAVAAAPAAFGWAGSRAGRRRLGLASAGLVGAMVVATGVQVAVARQQLTAVADRMPLVLFAGDSAEAPFPGWRRDPFTTITITDDRGSIAEGGHRAYLKYFTPGRVVFVTMHTDLGPCRDTTAYTCRVTGSTGGNELRRYERVAAFGSYPRSEAFDVIAYPDGTAVSVNDEELGSRLPGSRTPTQPVLARLVRVDRQRFEQATGARLRLA